MEKEFIPYEQALELKELGFDIPSVSGYSYADSDNLLTQAILYQQAFRWFREKYSLVIQYIPYEIDDSEGQSIIHHKYKISEYDSWRGGRRNTVETELNEDYEEAELACLKKLIEIAQTH